MSTAFEQFPLHPALLAGLERNKFSAPTQLQAQVIDPIFDGRDVMALAKGGAGQTLAFGLPLLSLLDPDGRPQAVVLVPHRDRCMHVWDVLSAIGAETGLSIVALHAGLGISQQEQMLRRGADIIVGTPGRVLDLLGPRRLDLSRVRMLVLDRADEIIQDGQRREVDALVERMAGREQTLVFAAAQPDGLEDLTRKLMKDPVAVSLLGAAPKPARAAAAPAVEASADDEDDAGHFYMHVDAERQVEVLISLIKAEAPTRTLVFINGRAETKRLAQQLERGTDMRTSCILADMSANARSSTLGRFRSGDHRVLIVADQDGAGLPIDADTVIYYLDPPAGEPEAEAAKTVYLVVPAAEPDFKALFKRIPCAELTASGRRAEPAAKPAPAPTARKAAAAPAPSGPDREPRRRNRLGATRAPAHGLESGALLATQEESRPSTGPLAPLPRMRMSWQTFKVSLEQGKRPNRDTVHSWLAQCTGIPRSCLRSIMVYGDHCTVEVESKEVEKFQSGLQDKLLG